MSLKKKKKNIYVLKRIKEQQIESLKKAAKYRREFLGNVSHELKTPIFNIQGYVHTLIDGAINDENVNLKYLQRTSKSIDRLIAIIDDLDSLASLESDELSIEKENWDILDLINEILESFEVKSKSKNINLVFPTHKSPIIVFADRDKISQVLYNLISNAIKYGKNGGFVKVTIKNQKEDVLISVEDNGLGVEEKNIPRLFERFYRVDKGRSREAGGTGLGLAIVKHILENHNEKIEVISKMNYGSKFIFSLSKNLNNE